MNSTNLKIGDKVKVKKGTECPDLKDLDIGGWQGEVLELEDEEGKTLVLIKWDDTTLENMPTHFTNQGEEEGLDNTEMYLYVDNIDLIE